MLTFIIILAAFFLIWKLTPNPANKKAVGMMFQMLESFYIIDSTTKIDIFTQRLDFLGKLASTLPTNADKNKCIDTAIQAYARKYYDKPISPTIKLILNQPQIASSLKFRDEAATAFYLRACDKLKAEIKTLKTANARQRRVTQASDLSSIIIDRLSSSERQKYIDCIREELVHVTDMASIPPQGA